MEILSLVAISHEEDSIRRLEDRKNVLREKAAGRKAVQIRSPLSTRVVNPRMKEKNEGIDLLNDWFKRKS